MCQKRFICETGRRLEVGCSLQPLPYPDWETSSDKGGTTWDLLGASVATGRGEIGLSVLQCAKLCALWQFTRPLWAAVCTSERGERPKGDCAPETP